MGKLAQILTLLLKRWKSRSPKRAKWVTNISVVVLIITVAVMQLFTLPGWVVSILEVVSIISTGLALDGKLKTEDNELVKETEKVKQKVKDRYRKSFFGNIFRRKKGHTKKDNEI